MLVAVRVCLCLSLCASVCVCVCVCSTPSRPRRSKLWLDRSSEQCSTVSLSHALLTFCSCYPWSFLASPWPGSANALASGQQ